MDQNPNRTPSEHPNPTTKICLKWVVNSPTPKWDPKTVLTPAARLPRTGPGSSALEKGVSRFPRLKSDGPLFEGGRHSPNKTSKGFAPLCEI